LTSDEAERQYRHASDPVARSQWQIVWLRLQEQTTTQVEAATGYSATWIRTVVRRYNADGLAGIGDQRHTNPGGRRLLNDADAAALDLALEGLAPDGGVWTSAQVAAWMSNQLGHRVSVATGWRTLRRLDWRLQRPRPQHVQAADAETQAAWKKGRSEQSSSYSSSTPWR